MEHKATKKIRLKLISIKKSGCKMYPFISLCGSELLENNFLPGDHVIIEMEKNKIVINRTLKKKDVVILKQITHENPDVQRLVETFGLVIL
jgi:hypothetical protein